MGTEVRNAQNTNLKPKNYIPEKEYAKGDIVLFPDPNLDENVIVNIVQLVPQQRTEP